MDAGRLNVSLLMTVNYLKMVGVRHGQHGSKWISTYFDLGSDKELE